MTRRLTAADRARWRVFGDSVPGAAHVRRKLPNQDAFGYWPQDGIGAPLVTAVADGHGAVKSFRSDVGALLAVNTALHVLWNRVADAETAPDHDSRAEVSHAIVDRWRSEVARDIARNPFSADELKTLEAASSHADRAAVEKDPFLAYGTTLLAVVVTPRDLVFLQLGDGDILTVARYGAVDRPFSHDDRLLGNQTTSMASDDAARNVRIAVRPYQSDDPALVLLSTDGYANSFADDAGFLQVGSDLYHMLRENSIEEIHRSLQGWLDETSRLGAGDDVTLAVVCHLAALGSGRRATIPDIDAHTLTSVTESDLVKGHAPRSDERLTDHTVSHDGLASNEAGVIHPEPPPSSTANGYRV